MLYLHLVNGISILSAALIYCMAIEPPLRLIKEGKQDLAKYSLNFISFVNSYGVNSYTFDNVTICATKSEIEHFKKQDKIAQLFIHQKLDNTLALKS